MDTTKVFKFIKTDNNLKFLKNILDKEDIYLANDLEIDPFDKFSSEFSAQYWYIMYHLCRDKKILIDDETNTLFEEDNLNIITFTITDFKKFSIECIDGDWRFKILEMSQTSDDIYKKLKQDRYI